MYKQDSGPTLTEAMIILVAIIAIPIGLWALWHYGSGYIILVLIFVPSIWGLVWIWTILRGVTRWAKRQ